MLSLRNAWRRHKRKILITAGIVGSGYALYKFYESRRLKLADLERLVKESVDEELTKSQMKAHFDYVQGIAETIIPHSIQLLIGRVAQELDHSNLIEALEKSRSKQSKAELLELWEALKILSFVRLVVSLWAVTTLTLYIRVKVNIVGRYLYIDIAQRLQSSDFLEDQELSEWDDQEKFLSSVDYLSKNGFPGLISTFNSIVTEALKSKQLRDSLTAASLEGLIVQMLDAFMETDEWIDLLMANDEKSSLMAEARAVLASEEFAEVALACFRALVESVVGDTVEQFPNGGVPLAKLLPRVAQMASPLLDCESVGKYIDRIRGVPLVEPFFTVLYANVLPI